MQILFPKDYKIDNFEELRERAKSYADSRLEVQHREAVESLESYRKFKQETEDLSEVAYTTLSSHRYKYMHCLNVARNCIKLASIEDNVSIQIMELAGILHDVGYFACEYSKHGTLSAMLAKEFLLKESNLPREDIEKIGKIINSHKPENWDVTYYCGGEISLEEILLLQADFLDKLSLKSGVLSLQESGSKKENIMEALDSFERTIIKKSEDILKRPLEKRRCHYTDSFLNLLEEQYKYNKEIMDDLRSQAEVAGFALK